MEGSDTDGRSDLVIGDCACDSRGADGRALTSYIGLDLAEEDFSAAPSSVITIAMAMREFRKLLLECDCGVPPSRLHEVGLTATQELVVHWWCGRCKKHVYAVKSLSRRPDRRPEGERSLRPAHVKHSVSTSDSEFLRSIGVCMPAEVET